MQYRIKPQVKIREEDGFYLLVNLTTEDMISGYPAFFKINRIGKITIDTLDKWVTLEDIVAALLLCFPNAAKNCLKNDTEVFISKLQRYSLIEVSE